MPVRIRHILCPIDFSAGSRHALDYAVILARWYRARVSVLHVSRLAIPVYGVSYLGPEGLQPVVMTEAERQQLLDRLNTEVAEDRSAAQLQIDTILDEAVHTPDAILARAGELSVDLLVMGTHGRSGFERLLIGSVTEKVLRKAQCAVLTVPPRAADAVPREIAAIQRILCPLDFSAGSEQALAYAASLAQEAKATLTALHVIELPPDLSEFPYSGLTEYREARFQQATRRLSDAVKASVPPTCTTQELVLVGRSYREILRVASDQASDLIAMGIHGRGAADLLFFGSTTNHVVRAASCPVLTLRGDRR